MKEETDYKTAYETAMIGFKMQMQEIERLKEENKKHRKWIDSLNKDNHRLNNIINELEKWLEEQHQFIIEIPAFTKGISIEHKTMELCYENILDKLQELKGSDKE